MESSLVELYRHNLWANLRLIDACATLKDELLDASAPGTYGRVRDTLVHIVGGEQFYISVLTSQERPPRLERQPFPGLPALRDLAQASGEALIRLAANDSADPFLEGVGRDGEHYHIPRSILLIQAINHGTEHRSHVVSILTQRGVEVPGLDGWEYEEAIKST